MIFYLSAPYGVKDRPFSVFFRLREAPRGALQASGSNYVLGKEAQLAAAGFGASDDLVKPHGSN
jgi:hypothetical protein